MRARLSGVAELAWPIRRPVDTETYLAVCDATGTTIGRLAEQEAGT